MVGAYKSICRRPLGAGHTTTPLVMMAEAGPGFGGGGGGGGGARRVGGGRRTDRDVDWPDVTRDSASAAAVSLSRRRAASRRCA